MSVQLYSYFRSSASYRVRIALKLKNIKYDYIPVHLVNHGGEHLAAKYRQINPMAEVPALIHDGRTLSQSMAILQYLDDIWPQPRLFPQDPYEKAQVIQICESINSGIHPVQNLKVLNYLRDQHGFNEAARTKWAHHWIQLGFERLENMLLTTAGTYCYKGGLTAADLYLVPQIFNARRFKVDLNPFQTLLRIEAHCSKIEAFRMAAPEQQPDSPKC